MIIFVQSNLIQENIVDRLEMLASLQPNAIVLREKNIKEENYLELAKKCQVLCKNNSQIYIAHRIDIAKQLGVKNIHLSLEELIKNYNQLENFDKISVAIHSFEDLQIAQKYKISNVVVGHIFDTDCKRNLQSKGLVFLKNIVEKSLIPVWAIGGINQENFAKVLQNGASDYCIMSSAMTFEKEKLKHWKTEENYIKN